MVENINTIQSYFLKQILVGVLLYNFLGKFQTIK